MREREEPTVTTPEHGYQPLHGIGPPLPFRYYSLSCSPAFVKRKNCRFLVPRAAAGSPRPIAPGAGAAKATQNAGRQTQKSKRVPHRRLGAMSSPLKTKMLGAIPILIQEGWRAERRGGYLPKQKT